MNPLDLEPWYAILLRLGVAALWGALLGVNRDMHHKPAGVRVLALVALGSALLTVVSVTGVTEDPSQVPDGVTRTVQGIIAGIGFLGAGVIMRGQGPMEVHGMTTAVSIWMSAALGVASGLAQWRAGGLGFVIGLVILTFGKRLERRVAMIAPKK